MKGGKICVRVGFDMYEEDGCSYCTLRNAMLVTD